MPLGLTCTPKWLAVAFAVQWPDLRRAASGHTAPVCRSETALSLPAWRCPRHAVFIVSTSLRCFRAEAPGH